MPTTDTSSIQTSAESTAFTSGIKGADVADSTYNDFFQETGDGNISIGKKAQKSGLEIVTTILGYILPVAIIIALATGFHVYIQKGGGATAIKENYNFLCSYLNYSITLPSEEYKCDTVATIGTIFEKKKSDLQENILEKLNEYIPIKLTKNLLITSPERKFAETTFNNKLRMDVVMNRFEEVLNGAKSPALEGVNNIICNGMSITGDGSITTQCTIYGGTSGNDDENGKLGSARIEALRFVNFLSDTSNSQFILLNPPTSLSMERITDNKDFSSFETRTTLSIQATYVPFSDKN